MSGCGQSHAQLCLLKGPCGIELDGEKKGEKLQSISCRTFKEELSYGWQFQSLKTVQNGSTRIHSKLITVPSKIRCCPFPFLASEDTCHMQLLDPLLQGTFQKTKGCLLQELGLKHGCKLSIFMKASSPPEQRSQSLSWLKDRWKLLQSKVKCCAGRFRTKHCRRWVEFPQKWTESLWSSEGQDLFPMSAVLVFVST